MGLLSYKSNEMFSSTELIRKSKSIFDKILGKKIEKAIILRDGKPSFLLMEFSKYEKIMAEYEKLKEFVENGEEGQIQKPPKQKKQKTIEDKELKKELEEEAKAIRIEADDYEEDEKITKVEELESKQNEAQKEVTPKDEPKELSLEEELQKAYESIEKMDLDPAKKEQGREKIKQKIITAREEKKRLLAEQEQHLQEESKKEKEILQEKLKKEQELEEFWD